MQSREEVWFKHISGGFRSCVGCIPSLAQLLNPINYEIKHDANGSSYNDPDKYIKHGKLLEKAYKEEEDEFLKNRYAFYCAQSYKDCNEIDKAIKWYTIVSKQKNRCYSRYLKKYFPSVETASSNHLDIICKLKSFCRA